MAKKRTKRKKPTPRGSTRPQSGRVVNRPKWENSWNRASSESSSISWRPTIKDDGTIDRELTQNVELATHEEIFKVYDQIEGEDDGLGTLAVLASIFDETQENQIDVITQLRTLAVTHTSNTEANLFQGYISPDTSNPSNADNMAGKILRHYRDRDLDALVQAVNTLPSALEKNTFIGILALSTLFVYEVFRDDNQVPLDLNVFNFLNNCDLPIVASDSFLEILCSFNLCDDLSDIARETIFDDQLFTPQIETKLIERKPVIENLSYRFLHWALKIENELNSTQPTSSLPQCGGQFFSSFAQKTSLMAIIGSESSLKLQSANFDTYSETTFHDWMTFLKALSPKGFEHTRLQDFTPDDLIFVNENSNEFNNYARLLSRFESRLAKQDFDDDIDTERVESLDNGIWRLCQHIVMHRGIWLKMLSQILCYEDITHENFEQIMNKDVFRALDLFGPQCVVLICQQLVLIKILEQNATEIEDPSLKSNQEETHDEFLEEEFTLELEEKLIHSFTKRLRSKTFEIEETRSIEKWLELLSEFYGLSPTKPENTDLIPTDNSNFAIWLSQAWWCMKHKSWKPVKERPQIEDQEPPPKKQPPPIEKDKTQTQPTKKAPFYPKETVKLIFVGGDWRHAKHNSTVEALISDKYGELVTVAWNHIDHSNQWHKQQEKICGQIRKADALIISPIIRTNMGWHLRREASKSDIPWIPCPTAGIQGVNSSLEEAIQVVCEIRETSKSNQ